MTTAHVPMRIRVPADPAMALSLRAFVATAARRTASPGDVEDLKLTATELLANAVEHASDELELTLDTDDEGWRLRARGAGALDGTGLGPEIPFTRVDLLRQICRVQVDGDDVVCAGPLVPPADG